MSTVVDIRSETRRAKTFRLRLPTPAVHLAGQHFLVRLTAPDGYTATRSYSVASAPVASGPVASGPVASGSVASGSSGLLGGSPEIELTVERLADGEVSTYLHDEVMVGDELEVRGPIGGWFVWPGDTPATLVGGGSGLVPLMAMLRLARRLESGGSLVRLVVSVRSPSDLYYATELPGPEVTVVYSRQAPPSSPRPAGRLVLADIEPVVRADATSYVCGSASFANAASDLLMGAGVPAQRIRVERFGPTG
jgi:ferredoxin-NADP reductase